jgi:hypothetical protein
MINYINCNIFMYKPPIKKNEWDDKFVLFICINKSRSHNYVKLKFIYFDVQILSLAHCSLCHKLVS